MYRRIFQIIFICFVSGGAALAQRTVGVAAMPQSASGASGKMYYASRNEPPRAIEFEGQTVGVSHFISNINRYFNIPDSYSFVETERNTDKLGMNHYLLSQYYNGIPIEGMGYRVHERNGFVTSANGRALSSIILPDIQTQISEPYAYTLATKYVNSGDTTFRAGKKLIVSKDFTFKPESFSVAYQFDVDVSLAERWRISIDARDGKMINKVTLVHNCGDHKDVPQPVGRGTGITNYYGEQSIAVEQFSDGSSRMAGLTENGGKIATYNYGNRSVIPLLFGFDITVSDFYSRTNTYNSRSHREAVSVQWAAEQAYEYYFNKHGRDSYNNNGAAITSYVHVDVDFNNAFWNGKVLAFGDGINNKPLVELDIVTHELTHGVTEYEAGLNYSYEPGALNESFSDIFGKAAEFSKFGDTATWLVGRHWRDGGLRNFSNPNLQQQPDTYLGDLWYTGYDDSGGVHYNSGVQNFWFYLLCEGGTGVNDHDVNYSVNSIGMNAAEKIAYRNLSEYLTYFSEYLDSRIGSLLATADLYGKNSSIYQEVDKAWDAVGVIDEPIIQTLDFYDITATTVKINGSLTPRGDHLTYHFEYGPTPSFGGSTSSYEYNGSVTGSITGLQSQTKYYVRLVATNENGSSSFTSEFTTIPLAPMVRIRPAINVMETSAMLRAEVNANSVSGTFYFEYGLTPAMGSVTQSYPLNVSTEYVAVAAHLENLQPRQTYYFRVVADNGHGAPSSETATFFTATRPLITSFSPANGPPGTVLTITGQDLNPDPAKNVVWFGATRATVLAATSSELQVNVPAGATLGPIMLEDSQSGLITQSPQSFVPTFAGEFKTGSLQRRVGINVPHIWSTAIEDIDGDGRPDIVGTHYQGFSVYQNTLDTGGEISEEAFVRNTYNVTDFYSSKLHMIDLDGNGLKDMINLANGSLRVYPNFSVPGFVFFGTPVDIPLNGLREVSLADFDHDGRVDIVGVINTEYENTLIKILKNQSAKGSIAADNFEEQYSTSVPFYVYYLTSADLNNDGLPELMAGPHYTTNWALLENTSTIGSYSFNRTMIDDATRSTFARYFAEDLNQDGRRDVIVHSPAVEGSIAVFESGPATPGVTLQNPVKVIDGILENAAKAGDLNGDGKVDLVVAQANRSFIVLENHMDPGAHFSPSSFKEFGRYGMTIEHDGVTTQTSINDLNGDGRPEIINSNQYSYGPRDGYALEIYANTVDDCVDLSLLQVEAGKYAATIILPPNTTFDQFEIDYRTIGSSWWNRAYSTNLGWLSTGYKYELRARAKCYLDWTGYSYLEFVIECVDTKTFAVSSVGYNSAKVTATDLGMFEIQYSKGGENQWKDVLQYNDQITNLSAGTRYDIRFRGRCSFTGDFHYKEFTTLCAPLSGIRVGNIRYNSAVIQWTSAFGGEAVIEYSEDNINWLLMAGTGEIQSLKPATTYYVRGRLLCPDASGDYIYRTFTTLCPAVSNIQVSTITPFTAEINWTDESGTGMYIVNYLIEGGAPSTVETNTMAISLDGLSAGTQYVVTIAPQCTGSAISTSAAFITNCFKPINLSANATNTDAEISWDEPFSGVPYTVEYAIAETNVWYPGETASTSASLAGLRPGTRYEARVHISCPDVQPEPYASVFFETGLYDKTTFFPNPTWDQILIHPSKSLIGKPMKLLDSMGKVIVEGKLMEYTFDLSALPPGVYTLMIQTESNMRIVKQ